MWRTHFLPGEPEYSQPLTVPPEKCCLTLFAFYFFVYFFMCTIIGTLKIKSLSLLFVLSLLLVTFFVGRGEV